MMAIWQHAMESWLLISIFFVVFDNNRTKLHPLYKDVKFDEWKFVRIKKSNDSLNEKNINA